MKVQDKINQKDKVYLKISQEMYKKSNERTKTLYFFDYNEQLSTEETGFWINKSSKQIILGFRGNTYSLRDIWTQTVMMKKLLKDSWRYKDNLKHVKEIKDLYTDYTYTYTGGGLGGHIAIELLWQYPKDIAIVFNAGCNSKTRYRGLNIRYYTGYGDSISVFERGSFNEYILIENNNYNPQKIANPMNKCHGLYIFD